MLRGLAADLAWRGRQTNRRLAGSALRIALGVAVILSLPAGASLFTDKVVWSLADYALAGVLLAVIGVALELTARKAGNLASAIGIGAVGVIAAVLGKAGDAPGLVLLGILLVASGCALGVVRARAQQNR